MENNEEKESSYKSLVIRCPRLGGEVPFAYCEKEAGDLPCRIVVSCWERIFPVEEYLRKTMTEEAWSRLNSQAPKDRLANIFDIVDRMRKNNKI